jgi:hypothetical protein
MPRPRPPLALALLPLLALAACGSSDKLTSARAGGVVTTSGSGGGASTGAGGGDTTTDTSAGTTTGTTTTDTTSTTTGTTGPGAGVFDADRMYVIGTLQEGAGGLDVFCDVLDPEHPSGGFPSSWAPAPAAVQRNAYVRPIDGRLVYLAKGVVYAFEPDALGSSPAQYPKQPLANDAVVPTPGCAGVTAFHVLTADNSVVYTCGEGWFDDVGVAFPTCPEPGGPLRIDDYGAQLCEGSVLDPAGKSHARAPSPPFVSVRAKADGGFWGVAVGDTGLFERWSIDHDGATTLDGTYAPLPDGLTKVNADVPGWVSLDAIGNLYRWAEADALVDVVVRFSADFQGAEIVYDEATKPACKLHGFNFVASP